jgi:SOS-response transcriptional repressor LexA
VLCKLEASGGAPLAVVKKYQSIRESETEHLVGEATRIILSSLNPKYENIELKKGDEVRIIGILESITEQTLEAED